MFLFDHHILNIIRKIFRAERDQIFRLHDVADRYTLIDQPGYRKCVKRRHDDHDIFFMGEFSHLLGYLYTHSHNNTADVFFDGSQMIFFSVTDDQHIIFFDIVPHHIGPCGTHKNLAFYKITMFIAFNHLTA